MPDKSAECGADERLSATAEVCRDRSCAVVPAQELPKQRRE